MFDDQMEQAKHNRFLASGNCIRGIENGQYKIPEETKWTFECNDAKFGAERRVV